MAVVESKCLFTLHHFPSSVGATAVEYEQNGLMYM